MGVKYSDFHVVGAKVGKAGVSVDEHNHVGLTVSDVSFNIHRTPFTVQEKGLLTFPCSGVLEGVISGAVNAVEAVIKLSAEGVPIVGEAAASPVDGAIVKIEHVLDGLCGALEDIIEDVLGLIKGLLGGVVGKLLPEVIEGLLKLELPSTSSDLKLDRRQISRDKRKCPRSNSKRAGLESCKPGDCAPIKQDKTVLLPKKMNLL